jgi:hypothetical protein
MSEERYHIRDKKIFGRKELTNKRWNSLLCRHLEESITAYSVT